jgi:hypothetical protein
MPLTRIRNPRRAPMRVKGDSGLLHCTVRSGAGCNENEVDNGLRRATMPAVRCESIGPPVMPVIDILAFAHAHPRMTAKRRK